MKHFIYRFSLLLMVLLPVRGVAQTADSLVVSLLTCSPGDIAYTMYGHTAIRVHELKSGRDIVFNYGMFNFDADNFIYKFVKGETDYVLGAEPADFFLHRYAEKGEGVTEQVLNLSQTECLRLYGLLLENIKPENRTYRYNWLYDNCTTRARDVIERAVEGDIDYHLPGGNSQTMSSARRYLHPFAQKDRWVEFGQNLLLGYEVDRPLKSRQSMFLPNHYMHDADMAEIRRVEVVDSMGGSVEHMVPLVAESRILLPARDSDADRGFDMPFALFLAVFVVVLAFNIAELRRGKTFKWIDIILCLLVGLAGVLISFLFFFSEHAGVSTNMLVILFNPLAFLWIPFVWRRHTLIPSYAILAEFAAFAVAIIAVGQYIDPALWLLVSTLLLRVAVNIWLSKQKSLTLHTKSSPQGGTRPRR